MITKVNIKRGYKRLDSNLRVPTTGRYVQIKTWSELGHGDNATPFPQVIDKGDGLLTVDPSGRVYDYVLFEPEWQWAIWRLLDWGSQYRLPRGRIEGYYQRPNNERIFARTTPGSLTYVYVDIIEAHRMFTESASVEGGRYDAVTSRNPGALPFEYLFRPHGKALLKVLRERGTYYTVKALDTTKPPPSTEEIVAEGLYFWGTQWGKYQGSTRIPQIKNANEVWGLPPAGVPLLLLSVGGQFDILKSSCHEMSPGQLWTPYTNYV